jgi:hypothetical protein
VMLRLMRDEAVMHAAYRGAHDTMRN